MKKVTLLAVGGAGCRVMREISALAFNDEYLRLLAADTDVEALGLSGVPEENRLTVGGAWRAGRGCGGNVIDGQRAFAHERAGLEKLLKEAELVLVIAGLGGGCGSGGVPVIQSVLSKLRIPAVFLLTLPFSMEGHSKGRIAEKVIAEELPESAGAVIPLPNDLLFSTLPPEAPLNEAFRLADLQTARTALALTVLLNSGNLLGADYATLSAFFRRRRGDCGIGTGTVESDHPERLRLIVEQVLDSPLLGGAGRLREANAVILSLNGPGLTLGETKSVFETIGKYLSPQAEVFSGAGDVKAWGNLLQLTVLAVKFPEVPQMTAPCAGEPGETLNRELFPLFGGAVSDPGDMVQQTLPFPETTLGTGIMERTTPVVVNGENLDIPTFIRRRIVIDNGKKSSN